MRFYKVSLLFFILLITSSCSHRTSEAKDTTTFNDIDLFDDSKVHTIKINFYYPHYWDSITSFKEVRSAKFNNIRSFEQLIEARETESYIPCKIQIDGNTIDSIGIRAKGESSYDFYPSRKKSLKIKLNAFIKNQKYNGIKKFSLNNNFKDPTMIREKLMLDFIRDEGLPAPRGTFVKLYLNEKYWGLYLLVEEIDKEFIKTTFNGDSIGNLYKGEPFPNLAYEGDSVLPYFRKYLKKTNEKQNDWSDIINFTKTINAGGDNKTYSQNLSKELNVTACLKIWAINNLFVNIDAYNMLFIHNFYLYRNPADQKFHWINYDFNYGFGAWTPKYNLKEVENFPVLFVNTESRHHPLAKKLLIENKNFRSQYLAIMDSLVDNSFTVEKMNSRITKYHKMIKAEVLADKQKMYSNEDFEKNIQHAIGDTLDPGAFVPGLKDFVEKRRQNVLLQLQAIDKVALTTPSSFKTK